MGKFILNRHISLNLPQDRSAFLWGPRKCGKSWWLNHQWIPQQNRSVVLLDLLKTDVLAEYVVRPSLLRERFDRFQGVIVIDEIQKIPGLLDEIHWLIENRGVSFLLTGSSARKLKKSHANLLGGRAWRRVMVPLSLSEIKGADLSEIIRTGLLPPHFLSSHPIEDLRAYVNDYLKEEIIDEALVQNVPAFSEFLRVAALTSSELLDYTNVASETGVSAKVVRSYFDILEQTFLGFRVPCWKKSKTRRMILTDKFYLFDVGVTQFLSRRSSNPGTPEFGKAFEQLILMELRAYQAYKDPELPISFWRTSTGQEVDFLLGEKDLAIEIKASTRLRQADLSSLAALAEDGAVKRRIVVSLEREQRQFLDPPYRGIEIWPWQEFVAALWSGEFF